MDHEGLRKNHRSSGALLKAHSLGSYDCFATVIRKLRMFLLVTPNRTAWAGGTEVTLSLNSQKGKAGIKEGEEKGWVKGEERQRDRERRTSLIFEYLLL